ncbi:cyclopropane-fatty-acyl-phospholipid synthase family protein [Rheinheimera sp.]|uniref:cyclopropane-fatty-acyl-phospholipid synthase family protein n=1 Tax=Rheinheimera sp. TaxID=1869214 RepID=UPI00307F7D17
MEQITNMATAQPLSWFEKRCRSLVFKALEQIRDGSLQLVEPEGSFYFGQSGHGQPADEVLHATLLVDDASLYKDIVLGGSIGAAEAFIAGKWRSPDLTALIRLFARAQQMTDQLEQHKGWWGRLKDAWFHRTNRNTKTGSKANIQAHYDLGNELYSRFLDPSMMYSAAVYPTAEASLAQAQQHKLQLICQKLQLSPADHLLEIGTGWGGLALFAAQHFGCKVTTTTISEQQYLYAQQQVMAAGLQDRITLLKQDYRDLTGQYDKLVSIEMIEAVGEEFMPGFFSQCNSLLKPGGKMVLQSITIADQRFAYYRDNVDFIQRYIFPGGFLPSVTELAKACTAHSSMVIEGLQDIGLDYARTLADWRSNFLANWPELPAFGYDERFKRLWLYYLAYCEGGFLERATSTVQLVLRKA